MKPTSVIFIIIAVMLACLGFLLCMSATRLANERGVELFTQTGDADNNFTAVKEFDSDSMRKIVIKVSDVDVNIYGGAEEDRLELVNFADGTYDYTVGKSTMQLSDNAGIASIVDIDNLKINFNGFRDYLHYYKYKDKQRSVNLYLTDEASVIIFNVTTGSGSVTLRDISLDCDYHITVGTGDVTLQNITTDSSVLIESTEDSTVNVSGLTCNELEIEAVTGYVTLKDTVFSRAMYTEIQSGRVEYDRVEKDFAGYNVLLRAVTGSVKLNSQKLMANEYTEENYFEPPVAPGTIDEDPADEEPEDGTDETDDIDGEETEEEKTSTQIADHTITVIVNEGTIEVY